MVLYITTISISDITSLYRTGFGPIHWSFPKVLFSRAWASPKTVKLGEAVFWWLQLLPRNDFAFTIFALVLALEKLFLYVLVWYDFWLWRWTSHNKSPTKKGLSLQHRKKPGVLGETQEGELVNWVSTKLNAKAFLIYTKNHKLKHRVLQRSVNPIN